MISLTIEISRERDKKLLPDILEGRRDSSSSPVVFVHRFFIFLVVYSQTRANNQNNLPN